MADLYNSPSTSSVFLCERKKEGDMEGENKRETTSSDQEEAQAQVDMWKYAFGFVDTAVVKCAIELGIADVLDRHEGGGGGPMTLFELSSALGCSLPFLQRVMRFLVHRRVFKQVRTINGSTPGFVQTPLSRLLMRNGEKSMAALVLFLNSPEMLAPWQGLSAHVLAASATSAFESAHGDQDIWSLAATSPSCSKLIDDAMACHARVVVPVIIGSFPKLFDGLDSLVDVGGGNGTTLRMLVEAHPWIQGVNLDLPHVVSEAPDCVGVEHVGGDMFESVPKADAAFLMWVLHDWGDEECIQILKNCKEAIPKDKGKVIIVEAVLEMEEEEAKEGDKLEHVRLTVDMVMLACTKRGKERTWKEWAYVLSEAGFLRHDHKRIQALQSVIVAYPA